MPIAIWLGFWILVFGGIYLIGKSVEDKNAKNLPVGVKGKNYFGLKFWIITILFFPFSLIYVAIKIIRYKNIDLKEKKYFGLKFWLITIFFFPISLVYVVIKIMEYQNEQNIKIKGSNKYQELYYKELYEKQRRENEKQLVQENQKENSE